jgi:hypothetical protein
VTLIVSPCSTLRARAARRFLAFGIDAAVMG